MNRNTKTFLDIRKKVPVFYGIDCGEQLMEREIEGRKQKRQQALSRWDSGTCLVSFS